ncbi:hypothetical protein MLD38_014808 [Melastoma candidum]|uniref:Uncharacterized protein n=1 Tax=Melastoma candidum TaxID=119954 RepID=A0ACB9RE21_9MYRT|nr:hypothetical protein MLD38_014808 [Melastoma candidum]
MGPFDSVAASGTNSPSSTLSSSSSSSSSIAKPPPPPANDRLLVDAGYEVRSSNLRHLACRLDHLDSIFSAGEAAVPSAVGLHRSDTAVPDGFLGLPFDACAAAHYNPSDLTSWVDTLLSEFSGPLHPDAAAQLGCWSSVGPTGTFGQQNLNVPAAAQPMAALTAQEEDSGIRLVHLLMLCAERVQSGEIQQATTLLDEMQALLSYVNTSRGIGKVASYFIDALSRRVLNVGLPDSSPATTYENEVLYHHFYEACPYFKYAHFTANQAILEAMEGEDTVHVIDFDLKHGLQWPALIQALALRAGGPPMLRLTGIGPPSPDGRDTLKEIGLRLAELAESVNVRFSFRGIVAVRLEDVKPWMLRVGKGEAVAINSIMQLHRLLGAEANKAEPIDSVLSWIREMKPTIVTVVEQEANHNQARFLERFTEALHYYSTVFDSLEAACSVQPNKALAEMYLHKEICNVVCCDGAARTERHEPLSEWRQRMDRAGFSPTPLGSNAYKQAKMLLTLFSADGYDVEENNGCLTLGWHSRPLIAASAWHTAPNPPALPDPNHNSLL